MEEIVLYTQRVEIVESYGERRDCADQNIPLFIRSCGYLPISVPNILETAKQMLEQLKPVGIIFSGGNSLVKYGGNAPERDIMEKELLRIALERQMPVYGFCRGMQVIEDYFGTELQDVRSHVAVKHKICCKTGVQEVNSYHNQACYEVPDILEALAFSEDGVIEAVHVKGKWILGTMWHPERENPFRREDIDRVKRLFNKEGWEV